MATQLQLRRGTNAQVTAFTGAEGEVSVNTTNDSLHVHDGSTAGGFELARADLDNVSDTDLNAALNGNTIGSLTLTSASITNLTLGGTAVTSTAAELNILDGVTSDATELNLVDGSSAGTIVNSAAVIYGAAGEVNATTLQIGGVSITSTPAEINLLDGVTATTAELNILDGVTATATEINLLDGVTATTAELNYVDGVISAIQDQLDSKAPTANPTFTGTLAAATLTADSLTVDTDTLYVDATNNRVGIGSSSPGVTLDVNGESTTQLRLTASDSLGASIVNFGDQANVAVGRIIYSHVNDSFSFKTNNVNNRLVIDSSGNVLVNRTSVFTTAKMEIQSDAGDASTLALNSIDTDGSILEFHKAGSTVGSIGTAGSQIYIGTGDTGLFFNSSTNQIYPLNTSTQANEDGTQDLGRSTARFKDIYLSGGAYLGGTGSANYLDDYEEGTWTPSLRRNDGTIDATATIAHSTYVKIGRLVTIKTFISSISAGSSDGTSYWRVNGIPFGGVQYSAFDFGYNSSAVDGGYVGDAGGNMVLVTNATPFTGTLAGQFMITLTFETNA